MKRLWLLIGLAIVLTGAAKASTLTGYACNGWGLTWLTGTSTCGAAPAPPSGDFLLADTGVVLLVDVGNKFLVQ